MAARGLAPSRARARDMVLRGTVTVAGRTVRKPAAPVSDTDAIGIADPATGYVSRAALKLRDALDRFALDVPRGTALDLGASTGGFTQVLLERGAEHVVALDVGHGQLHESLRADPRVTVLERVNARDLTLDMLPRSPDTVVSDMSFISIQKAAEPALMLAAPGALAVLLVKPQFELGPEWIGKGGIVRNDAPVGPMLDDRQAWLEGLSGWSVLGCEPAVIAGGDGNREFVLAGRRDG